MRLSLLFLRCNCHTCYFSSLRRDFIAQRLCQLVSDSAATSRREVFSWSPITLNLLQTCRQSYSEKLQKGHRSTAYCMLKISPIVRQHIGDTSAAHLCRKSSCSGRRGHKSVAKKISRKAVTSQSQALSDRC